MAPPPVLPMHLVYLMYFSTLDGGAEATVRGASCGGQGKGSCCQDDACCQGMNYFTHRTDHDLLIGHLDHLYHLCNLHTLDLSLWNAVQDMCSSDPTQENTC